jgi:hypothetical protein
MAGWGAMFTADPLYVTRAKHSRRGTREQLARGAVEGQVVKF